ncbi:MAG: hypothetical protein K1X94_03125 [Sandaracinaceae bacterium]|nr:hypothetical protein [Sandaracinaceae bacterium]
MSDARSMVVELSRGRVIGLLMWVMGGASLAGCAGHASLERERARTASEAPPSLVAEEARLAEAYAIVEDESAACPDRCRSADGVCVAAEHVCDIVEALHDVTLAPRCDRARAACRSGRELVSSCGCSAAR